MGRKAGYIMSDKQKQAIHEGRIKAKQAKQYDLSSTTIAIMAMNKKIKVIKEKNIVVPKEHGKPVLSYNGREEDWLDFMISVRVLLKDNKEGSKSSEIACRVIKEDKWKDVEGIKTILQEYFTLKKGI